MIGQLAKRLMPTFGKGPQACEFDDADKAWKLCASWHQRLERTRQINIVNVRIEHRILIKMV